MNICGFFRSQGESRKSVGTIPSHRVYFVSERKLGFFVKVKEDQNFNSRNILNILRIKIFI